MSRRSPARPGATCAECGTELGGRLKLGGGRPAWRLPDGRVLCSPCLVGWPGGMPLLTRWAERHAELFADCNRPVGKDHGPVDHVQPVGVRDR